MFEVKAKAFFFPTTGFLEVALALCMDMDSKHEEDPGTDQVWGSGKLFGLPCEDALGGWSFSEQPPG